MSELSERLREAHPNSQQYALGSNILLEAAQEIESLQAQLSDTYGDQYRSELYVEMSKRAEAMGYRNVINALIELERLKQPDVAGLVEALEEARQHVVVSPDPVRGGFIQEIDAALATHRKQGGER